VNGVLQAGDGDFRAESLDPKSADSGADNEHLRHFAILLNLNLHRDKGG
jgi:hypothetical protein